MHPTQDCVRVYLLGRFEVKSGDRVIIDQSWPRRKAKALFKHLALNHGGWLHREQLFDTLWPELEPAAANHNFRQTLYYLRQAFEEHGLVAPVVTADHSTVGLAPDTWVDVDAFREAHQAARQTRTDPGPYEQALELYSGDLLPEDIYEDWTQLQRDELRGFRRQLVFELASLHERGGQSETAIQQLEALVRLDPLDEDAHRVLIRLYAESGNRQRARRQYERLREALQRELGVEPSEDIEAVYQGILERRPAGLKGRGSVMEPRIQYARAADGVRIAFSTRGKGKPIVTLPVPGFAAIHGPSWATPICRQLARRLEVVEYDGRGTGLSDRNVNDFSLDASALDLQAVLEALGCAKVALFAPSSSAPPAIAEAAKDPGLISHLILWCPYGRGADFLRMPHAKALNELAAKDWNLYTETVIQATTGFSGGAGAHRAANLMQESVSQETYLAILEASLGFDAFPLLDELRCQTLVFQRRRTTFPTLDVATDLVSRIPAARLVVLEGESLVPWPEDVDLVLRTIDEFLSGGEERSAPLPSGMTAILFADIAESTTLTERLGDAAFRGKARALDGALRSVIRENGGTPIEGKLLGDGVLAVFTSARQAIEAAVGCGRAGDQAGLPLHLGLHAGDVIREEDPGGRSNVYGGAVNIAARISAVALPGEVLVSATVRSLALTSAGVRFEDKGERELKGVGEPMRVWAVQKAT